MRTLKPTRDILQLQINKTSPMVQSNCALWLAGIASNQMANRPLEVIPRVLMQKISIIFFSFLPFFPDDQRRDRHPGGYNRGGCDQCPAPRRGRCRDPAPPTLHPLLQNSHFLPFLRRNALRNVQTGIVG